MKPWNLRLLAAVVWAATVVTASAAEKTSVIVVVGAGGKDEYGARFAEWAEDWQNAARQADAGAQMIGLADAETDAASRLEAALAAAPKTAPEPLWIVLLGHGTATAGDGKFNARGTDVSSAQMAEWLKPFRREIVLVCGFSASGAWLKPLAKSGRVLVTATRSGSEINFARFGGFLSKAIADPDADLDQDGQTSLLEAYLAASRQTADWYREEGRLATEHALLDDNGDGVGTPADWFKGTRPIKKPKEGKVDGARAQQIHLLRSEAERALSPETRKQRDQLETELAALREQKLSLPEDEYLRRLEAILRELAELYRRK